MVGQEGWWSGLGLGGKTGPGVVASGWSPLQTGHKNGYQTLGGPSPRKLQKDFHPRRPRCESVFWGLF